MGLFHFHEKCVADSRVFLSYILKGECFEVAAGVALYPGTAAVKHVVTALGKGVQIPTSGQVVEPMGKAKIYVARSDSMVGQRVPVPFRAHISGFLHHAQIKSLLNFLNKGTAVAGQQFHCLQVIAEISEAGSTDADGGNPGLAEAIQVIEGYGG